MNNYPPQYQQLIDAETWAFIRQTDQWYPANTIDFTIARQRDIYNAMCREFFQGYPPGVSASDAYIDSADYQIPVRHYACNPAAGPSDMVRIVYFHGGGFVVGGLDSHDDICGEICAATRLPVTAVDYRLSPEHAHPAAFNDSVAAVRSLAAESPLLLCGDSAGGNLAASVCHSLRAYPPVGTRIVGQVLIYPGLGGDMSCGSYVTHAKAPMLTTRDVHCYAMIRHGGVAVAGDATSAPLRDTNFTRLPPTVVVSAECDPLADDGQQYCRHINDAGGQAVWRNEKGLVHGYLRARHSVERARKSFHYIVQSLSKLASTTH